MNEKKIYHIAVIGAGFAGLWALKTLRKKNIRVTLIDQNNYHTFLPLLYQVGAAEIEPEQIAYPIRTYLRNKSTIAYLRSRVESIDFKKQVITCNDNEIMYDYLIIAAGSTTDFFNVEGAEHYAFTLKTLDEAVILRNHILSCFERASYADDITLRSRLLTFVIVGGGPTGVEFSGALAELINGPLKKDFPALSPADIRIILIESSDRVLSIFNEKSSSFARKTLSKKRVEIELNKYVEIIYPHSVQLSDKTIIETETVLWTAGVKGTAVKGNHAFSFSRNHRIKVSETLQTAEYPNVYIAGDLAHIDNGGESLPMIAPVATQQGRHAAANILRQINGQSPRIFTYRDKGTMATIGRNAAITKIGDFEFRGFTAWVLWLVIHIMYLIGFRNKLFVMINWIWDYIFFERSVRLILPRCCDNPGEVHCSRHGSCSD